MMMHHADLGHTTMEDAVARTLGDLGLRPANHRRNVYGAGARFGVGSAVSRYTSTSVLCASDDRPDLGCSTGELLPPTLWKIDNPNMSIQDVLIRVHPSVLEQNGLTTVAFRGSPYVTRHQIEAFEDGPVYKPTGQIVANHEARKQLSLQTVTQTPVEYVLEDVPERWDDRIIKEKLELPTHDAEEALADDNFGKIFDPYSTLVQGPSTFVEAARKNAPTAERITVPVAPTTTPIETPKCVHVDHENPLPKYVVRGMRSALQEIRWKVITKADGHGLLTAGTARHNDITVIFRPRLTFLLNQRAADLLGDRGRERNLSRKELVSLLIRGCIEPHPGPINPGRGRGRGQQGFKRAIGQVIGPRQQPPQRIVLPDTEPSATISNDTRPPEEACVPPSAEAPQTVVRDIMRGGDSPIGQRFSPGTVTRPQIDLRPPPPVDVVQEMTYVSQEHRALVATLELMRAQDLHAARDGVIAFNKTDYSRVHRRICSLILQTLPPDTSQHLPHAPPEACEPHPLPAPTPDDNGIIVPIAPEPVDSPVVIPITSEPVATVDPPPVVVPIAPIGAPIVVDANVDPPDPPVPPIVPQAVLGHAPVGPPPVNRPVGAPSFINFIDLFFVMRGLAMIARRIMFSTSLTASTPPTRRLENIDRPTADSVWIREVLPMGQTFDEIRRYEQQGVSIGPPSCPRGCPHTACVFKELFRARVEMKAGSIAILIKRIANYTTIQKRDISIIASGLSVEPSHLTRLVLYEHRLNRHALLVIAGLNSDARRIQLAERFSYAGWRRTSNFVLTTRPSVRWMCWPLLVAFANTLKKPD
jgi:hypothetical protein